MQCEQNNIRKTKTEKRDQKAIKYMMDDLDTNGDGKMSLDEFLDLVSKVLTGRHEASHEQAS